MKNTAAATEAETITGIDRAIMTGLIKSILPAKMIDREIDDETLAKVLKSYTYQWTGSEFQLVKR